MSPEPTELHLVGCLTESIKTMWSRSGTLTPGINSLTFWLKELSHVMNGTTFWICSIAAFSALKIAPKPWRREKKEGDYVAKSKPVRHLVSIRHSRSSTAPSTTSSWSPVNFVSKDHEVKFEESAEQPAAQYTKEDLTKGDELKEHSQVRYEDENSMSSAGAPAKWGSDQTLNSERGAGKPVIRRSKTSTTEFGLITTTRGNILSAESISFRNKVDERVRAILNRSSGNELGEVERHHLHPVIIYDFFNASSHLSCNPSEIQIRDPMCRVCSKWHKNWFTNKNWKYREWQIWAGISLRGRSCPWRTKRSRSSSWRQKFTYSLTLCYVSGK